MSDFAGTPDSPWHEGERELQRRFGVADRMEPVGRTVLRTYLTDQHRGFYPLLPFIVIGAVAPDGAPWATVRAGRPGFLHSPDPRTLAIEAGRDPTDPADPGLDDGCPVGLVGLDLMTRRRNRLNGTIARDADDRFTVEVRQSFGNCPRYIQNRRFAFVRDPRAASPSTAIVSDRLGAAARRIVEAADTFFVASYADRGDEGRQVDVSHRGGRPGFVRIGPDGSLTVPDFNGNHFFNTLGNFMVTPRAGLAFIDFATGGMLQLTGAVEVILDSTEIAAFEGAERLWTVKPDRVVLRPDALPLRWRFESDGIPPSRLATES